MAGHLEQRTSKQRERESGRSGGQQSGEVFVIVLCSHLIMEDGNASTYLVSTAYFGHLGREDEGPIEGVVWVGGPLLSRLVVVIIISDGALFGSLLLGLGVGFWLSAIGGGSGFSRCRFGGHGFDSGRSAGGGCGVATSYAAETWKSQTARRGCRGAAVVGDWSLWRGGHAFGDLVEAVTDDLVDLLLACREIECRGERVRW